MWEGKNWRPQDTVSPAAARSKKDAVVPADFGAERTPGRAKVGSWEGWQCRGAFSCLLTTAATREDLP